MTMLDIPDVSIVIVSWNTRDLLLSCLASLHDAVGKLRTDIWVVDNNSKDDSIAAVKVRHPDVQMITNTCNRGFAAANNQAIVASQGRYILLLNSDTVAEPGSIERLLQFAETHPRAAAVGPKLLNPDHSFQGSFADFPSLVSELLNVSGVGRRVFGKWYPNYGPSASRYARRVDYIQGACMLVRRTALTDVGLMDEEYFMYSEEVDWCWRMRRAGWEVWFVPDAQICHYGGQSTGQMRTEMVQALYRSKVRFFRKFYGNSAATILQGIFLVGLHGKRMSQFIRGTRTGNVMLDGPTR